MIDNSLDTPVLFQPDKPQTSTQPAPVRQIGSDSAATCARETDSKTLAARQVSGQPKGSRKKGAKKKRAAANPGPPHASAKQTVAQPRQVASERTELLNKYLRQQNPMDLLSLQDRRDRRTIAQNTLALLQAPQTFPNDLLAPPQSLKIMIRACTRETLTYTLDNEELYHRREQALKEASKQNTKIEVTFETTLQACRRIKTQIGDAPVLCLNFASARNPGGGFQDGANAQEESLARASALHSSLSADQTMYIHNANEKNKRENLGLYSDVMIYSPQVPVFKDDTGKLVPPYPISFVSAPAINMSNTGKFSADTIQRARNNRVEKILSIAAAHGYQHLILGAWGCGVFKNPPADVANCFAQFLQPEKKFGTVFQTVTFAMTDLGLCQEFEQRLIGD